VVWRPWICAGEVGGSCVAVALFGIPCLEALEEEVFSAGLKFWKCRSGLRTSESFVEQALLFGSEG